MYILGDKVVYGTHGVCIIVDFETRTVDRKKVEYYVLEPVGQTQGRFYVPVHNQVAVAKMRRLLSREEIMDLLAEKCVPDEVWIHDENRRKQYYRELIASGNRASLIAMIKLLINHKQEQLSMGRKFHISDENFLREAQKMLNSEFSIVLSIPENEIENYIQSVIAGNRA